MRRHDLNWQIKYSYPFSNILWRKFGYSGWNLELVTIKEPLGGASPKNKLDNIVQILYEVDEKEEINVIVDAEQLTRRTDPSVLAIAAQSYTTQQPSPTQTRRHARRRSSSAFFLYLPAYYAHFAFCQPTHFKLL